MTQDAVRGEASGDAHSVLTVLERKVYIGNRRTKLGVRTRQEHARVVEHITQSHRRPDELHSGLGLPFDPRHPRFILIPQVLTRDRLPHDIIRRYDHDIVRNVGRLSSGTVDWEDLLSKRNVARLKKWKKPPVETWTEVVVSGPGMWTVERTKRFHARLAGQPALRQKPETPNIFALVGPWSYGKIAVDLWDGVKFETKHVRTQNPEKRFGPLLQRREE